MPSYRPTRYSQRPAPGCNQPSMPGLAEQPGALVPVTVEVVVVVRPHEVCAAERLPQSGRQISGDICQATDQHATHRDRHLDVISANVRAPSLRSNAPTRRRMDLREYPGRDGGSCRCVSTIEITAREARPGGGLRASRCAWWCAGHDRGHCQLWGAVLWLATRTRRPRIASMRTCVLRAYQRSSAARTCYAIAAAALGFTAVDTPKRI